MMDQFLEDFSECIEELRKNGLTENDIGDICHELESSCPIAEKCTVRPRKPCVNCTGRYDPDPDLCHECDGITKTPGPGFGRWPNYEPKNRRR